MSTLGTPSTPGPEPTRGPLGPVLEKFQMRAAASYAKHCKDPVAAAESDLLGRMRAALRDTTAGCFCDPQCPTCSRNDALLAETKEGA